MGEPPGNGKREKGGTTVKFNPEEHVWNDLKTHGIGRKPITSPSQMGQMAPSDLRQQQKLHDLMRSFFLAPTTSYAHA